MLLLGRANGIFDAFWIFLFYCMCVSFCQIMCLSNLWGDMATGLLSINCMPQGFYFVLFGMLNCLFFGI